MAADGNGDKALNRWHALIGMAVLLGGIVLSYANTRAETEENTRQIRQIQEDTVKKEQLEDIKQRLERIERKIDHEEELRISHR